MAETVTWGHEDGTVTATATKHGRVRLTTPNGSITTAVIRGRSDVHRKIRSAMASRGAKYIAKQGRDIVIIPEDKKDDVERLISAAREALEEEKKSENKTGIMVIHDPWDARGRKITVDIDYPEAARAKIQDYLENHDWDEERAEEKAAKLVQDELDDQQAEQEAEAERQAEREAAFAEAEETGERVELGRAITKCDGSVVECSQDTVVTYALPNGETETKRIHHH